jgi:hypothetical protein
VQDNGPIPQLAADDYTPGPASRESGFGELILMLRRRLPLISISDLGPGKIHSIGSHFS